MCYLTASMALPPCGIYLRPKLLPHQSFQRPPRSAPLAGTTGGNDRDGDVVADVVDQLDVKAVVGAVPVNTVE